MNQFTYTSQEFFTVSQMNKEKKQLTEEICNHFGLKRNEFRLKQGLVILQVKAENGKWLNYTNTITDFAEKIKNNKNKEFRLYTNLALN